MGQTFSTNSLCLEIDYHPLFSEIVQETGLPKPVTIKKRETNRGTERTFHLRNYIFQFFFLNHSNV